MSKQAYDHREACNKLEQLLGRNLLFPKKAEEVKTLGDDPAAAEKGTGTEQTDALKGAPGPAVGVTDDATNKKPAEQIVENEVPVSGTDGKTDTEGAKMKVSQVPENSSKEASIGAAFARGLVNKQAALAKKASEEDYITGKEMFHKKAAMLSAKTSAEAEAAANDFYSNIPRLHNNPFYAQIFEKCAAIKMAEDIAVAREEGGVQGSDEEIAAALQQAVAQDPELAAELEGEVTGDAVDAMAAAENQADVVNAIAESVGVPPEAVVEASQLIEAAAKENGMPVEDFVQVLDQAIAEGGIGGEGSAPAEEAAAEGTVKEAAYRRIAKAASLCRR